MYPFISGIPQYHASLREIPATSAVIAANQSRTIRFKLHTTAGAFTEYDDWSYAAINAYTFSRDIVIRDAVTGAVIRGNSPMAEGTVTGDVDGNGVLDGQDAVLLQSYLDSSDQWNYLTTKAADLTGDNKISTHDIRLIEQFASGEITALPNLVTIGDVNQDGTITIDDANLAGAYYSGAVQLTPVQLIAGDVDGNGTVDIVDALNINRYLNGIIEEFPYTGK